MLYHKLHWGHKGWHNFYWGAPHPLNRPCMLNIFASSLSDVAIVAYHSRQSKRQSYYEYDKINDKIYVKIHVAPTKHITR